MPDWKVVGINCREFGIRSGGLHCVAMNLHRLPQTTRVASQRPTMTEVPGE
ncbi:MAG: hypothetical protein H8E44_09710 [Planctomycetes bacterium]|nr:hypothetical protein [Planctomycetota bacterium]MBL7042466.1 hypothetical protein [Pirellulaceae bacterium]